MSLLTESIDRVFKITINRPFDGTGGTAMFRRLCTPSSRISRTTPPIR